ncbi:diaminopimelate epimerase [Cellulomonas shaoxiangyii]|uniref:Diaminopimelate epimerase n=1 Tax=Cellulomonas shaoxiangyii TaxID=2566013 RepID=A0A4P7SIK7_9CELL|nr:diaminopimelate epimerase [Cellulomonas shaoxiangyii]QCB93922.1 diaminopimelate epimerase [Cellulomonas shaoxiangyii]TGY85995.1 diaminopimelate epimerase [Cellulomonas shaoxiangyii]
MTVPVPVQAPASAGLGRVDVTKGHGTRNDFVLVDDRDGALDVTAELVRRLCDRRGGLGADGLIRLVATAHVPDAPADTRTTAWFMDYRNADGSVAQMCGNGVRVFARYLERLGLWRPETGDLAVGTRAGVRAVRAVDVPVGVGDDAWFAVDMGPVTLPGGATALAGGGDAEVEVGGLDVTRPGLGVDVGNPHTVVVLATGADLVRADLTRAPVVTPVPAEGTNVELVVPLGEESLPDGAPAGRVRMRVHERGVGETQSCGTGAVAAAAAVRAYGGAGAPDVWFVEVPGGTLRVTLTPGVGTPHAELAGPAVLVAEASVDLAALLA